MESAKKKRAILCQDGEKSRELQTKCTVLPPAKMDKHVFKMSQTMHMWKVYCPHPGLVPTGPLMFSSFFGDTKKGWVGLIRTCLRSTYSSGLGVERWLELFTSVIRQKTGRKACIDRYFHRRLESQHMNCFALESRQMKLLLLEGNDLWPTWNPGVQMMWEAELGVAWCTSHIATKRSVKRRPALLREPTLPMFVVSLI